jgi:hypothetical protein
MADEEHRLSATWTKHGLRFDGFGWIFVNCAPVDSELFADRFELLAGPAVEESVITEPVKAAGQGVLEVAPEELHPIDLEGIAHGVLPVFDGYTDGVLVRAQYPGIEYGALEEVGSEVFDGVLSTAKVLHVAVPANAPQKPDPIHSKHALLFNRLEQEGLQARGEDLAIRQPSGVARSFDSAVFADADCGDDEVDMRMQSQILGPGLEHTKEATLSAQMPGLLQYVLDRLGGAGEKKSR